MKGKSESRESRQEPVAWQVRAVATDKLNMQERESSRAILKF
jgi:hypothetical protein